MFDEPKTSLGDLDEYERGWMLSFLRGTSWEELFEELGDGSAPPSWLVEWSANWVADSIFTMDEMDPYWCEGHLVTDKSTRESWVVVIEPDETITCFEHVPVMNRKPVAESVWPIALKYLRSIGDFPILGHFTINPLWLPRSVMTDFMTSTMWEAGLNCLENDQSLMLEQWLRREYDGSRECSACLPVTNFKPSNPPDA
jgi:hypothetical protein